MCKKNKLLKVDSIRLSVPFSLHDDGKLHGFADGIRLKGKEDAPQNNVSNIFSLFFY